MIMEYNVPCSIRFENVESISISGSILIWFLELCLLILSSRSISFFFFLFLFVFCRAGACGLQLAMTGFEFRDRYRC
ncbi:hypothetical protein DFH27DRAFT_561620 [Peziza echinospora]|nr:hypothetical protein DFH27DRAFT_561620 [Peziza echinospora]